MRYTSIILIRILSKSTFGLWSYSLTIIKFFLIFAGFGAANAVLQFCSIEKTKVGKTQFFYYGLSYGILTTLFISLIIFISTFFINYSVIGSNIIIRSLFLMPLLVFFYRIISNYLRSNFKNIEYSIINSINTILILLFTIVGAYFFNIKGLIFGRYLSYLLTVLIGYFFVKKLIINNKDLEKLNNIQKKEFTSFSIISALTNSVSQMLYLIDIFLIGLILGSSVIIASYKTATIIPFNLNFIAISIMTIAYPYFASKYKQKKIIKKYFYKLQIILFIVNTFIGIILFIFAPFVIVTLFGNNYSDSILPFRILLIGFVFAGTFRIPAGNLLLSLKKVKINFYIAIFCGLINIGLNYYLIKMYGSIGAALATVFVIIVSSVLSNIYLLNYLNKSE